MNDIPSYYNPTANEPKVHGLIKKSFFFVNTAGMRHAPEVLIMELFREVFFEQHSGNTAGAKDLDPDMINDNGEPFYSPGEKAVLYALRGRRKNSINSAVSQFFAPPYPALAQECWLRKKSDRAINNFLLSGPIAQYLWKGGPDVVDSKEETEKFSDLLIRALVGNNSFNLEGVSSKKDILSLALKDSDFKIDLELAKQKLREKTYSDLVIRLDTDELSSRIYNDIKFLCLLEKDLPRMQWLYVLMTFLRFALPLWLLAQMQLTSMLHGWLLKAIDQQELTNTSLIVREIESRNRNLLHPTLSPTREVFEKIETYMKHRVEVNVLLYALNEIKPSAIKDKKLGIDSGGANKISVEQLILEFKNSAGELKKWDRFEKVANGLDYRRFLIREGEMFHAWRNPLKRGQGKNIDEFFRVMYRAESGDEAGGSLLIRQKGAGFRVFPGQMLLKTIIYLAAQEKSANGGSGGGKLVLEDIENHFIQYGIDFSYAADARPLLMQEMQAMGLLAGSPDAGSSVAVSCPY